jgi:hypothetical protein
MTNYEEQVEAALRAVTILSRTRFCWFDQASPPLPRKTLRALDSDAARAYLLAGIRQALYLGFYAAGAPVPDAAPPARLARSPGFIQKLSTANAGRGCWTGGWLVRSLEDDGVVGEREELRVWAPAGSWRGPVGARVRIGATIEFLEPKGELGASPGFYRAQGDVHLLADRASKLARVYFNTTAAGAVLLMANLTSALNELELPFRFKVVDHPDCFTRCDAAVLYLEQDDFERAAPALARAVTAAAGEIGARVPAFTKRLGPGVAVAEDPTEDMSFGWHRSTLVAEGILDAHERGVVELGRRVDCVRKRFAGAGLSLDAPYLNEGSCDRYTLTLEAAIQRPVTFANRLPEAGKALELAKRIGEELAAGALWHEDRCSWLGPDSRADPATGVTNVRRTLGPALDGGTSGVALFLAELGAATSNVAFQTTSAAAARQALFGLAKNPAARNSGVEAGWPGIALAVSRVGRLTGDAPLVERARALVASRRLDVRSGDTELSDLLESIVRNIEHAVSRGDAPTLERLESVEKGSRSPDPGLMRGAAGLGLFLLRVACQRTPSARAAC